MKNLGLVLATLGLIGLGTLMTSGDSGPVQLRVGPFEFELDLGALCPFTEVEALDSTGVSPSEAACVPLVPVLPLGMPLALAPRAQAPTCPLSPRSVPSSFLSSEREQRMRRMLNRMLLPPRATAQEKRAVRRLIETQVLLERRRARLTPDAIS